MKLSACLVLLVLCGPALAEAPTPEQLCTDFSAWMEKLEKYNERPIGRGVAGVGAAIELQFASPGARRGRPCLWTRGD